MSMSVSVFTTESGDRGQSFDTLAEAERWLLDGGFQLRKGKRGRWVKLLATGNLFASVVTDKPEVWRPNFGAVASKAINGE